MPCRIGGIGLIKPVFCKRCLFGVQMSYEICKCHCHSDSNVRHIMPCCMRCKICDKNIIDTHHKNHEKKCLEKREKLLETLLNDEGE